MNFKDIHGIRKTKSVNDVLSIFIVPNVIIREYLERIVEFLMGVSVNAQFETCRIIIKAISQSTLPSIWNAASCR